MDIGYNSEVSCGRGFHVTHCDPKAERGRGAERFPLTIVDASLYKDDEWFELRGT